MHVWEAIDTDFEVDVLVHAGDQTAVGSKQRAMGHRDPGVVGLDHDRGRRNVRVMFAAIDADVELR